MIRLERGGAEFLGAVTERMLEMGVAGCYSPALYEGSTRVWRRAGYHDYAKLVVMERSLDAKTHRRDGHPIMAEPEPDWDAVLEIDRLAFAGFWGMSRNGLIEAHATNRVTTLLVATGEDHVRGYAIVGTQWGVTYLHRIAVRPDAAGKGVGSSLLAAAVDWGAGSGGRTMILNVRAENHKARELYERSGFSDTGTGLLVLRHEPR